MSSTGGDMPAGAVLRVVGYAACEGKTPEDILELYDKSLKSKFATGVNGHSNSVFLKTDAGVALGMVMSSPMALEAYKTGLKSELIEMPELQEVMNLESPVIPDHYGTIAYTQGKPCSGFARLLQYKIKDVAEW